jgi:hypothetical protein
MSDHIVVIRFRFDDEYRKWIAHRQGHHGKLATIRSVRQHLEQTGLSMDMDLVAEYEDCDQGCQP